MPPRRARDRANRVKEAVASQRAAAAMPHMRDLPPNVQHAAAVAALTKAKLLTSDESQNAALDAMGDNAFAVDGARPHALVLAPAFLACKRAPAKPTRVRSPARASAVSHDDPAADDNVDDDVAGGLTAPRGASDVSASAMRARDGQALTPSPPSSDAARFAAGPAAAGGDSPSPAGERRSPAMLEGGVAHHNPAQVPQAAQQGAPPPVPSGSGSAQAARPHPQPAPVGPRASRPSSGAPAPDLGGRGVGPPPQHPYVTHPELHEALEPIHTSVAQLRAEMRGGMDHMRGNIDDLRKDMEQMQKDVKAILERLRRP